MPEEMGRIGRFVKHFSDDESKLVAKLRQKRAAKNINKEYQERLRAVNDYEVNLKAEVEIQKLHEKMDMIIKKLQG